MKSIGKIMNLGNYTLENMRGHVFRRYPDGRITCADAEDLREISRAWSWSAPAARIVCLDGLEADEYESPRDGDMLVLENMPCDRWDEVAWSFHHATGLAVYMRGNFRVEYEDGDGQTYLCGTPSWFLIEGNRYDALDDMDDEEEWEEW